MHREYNERTVDTYLTKNGERTIFHLDTRCEIKDDVVLAGYKWVAYTQGLLFQGEIVVLAIRLLIYKFF
jgi:hypothetical protein